MAVLKNNKDTMSRICDFVDLGYDKIADKLPDTLTNMDYKWDLFHNDLKLVVQNEINTTMEKYFK